MHEYKKKNQSTVVEQSILATLTSVFLISNIICFIMIFNISYVFNQSLALKIIPMIRVTVHIMKLVSLKFEIGCVFCGYKGVAKTLRNL